MLKFISLIFAISMCGAATPHHIFYWDLPPYIWKDNGTVKGSIKEWVRTFEKLCNVPKSEFFQVKGGYKDFVEVLYRQTYVETDKGNVTVNTTDFWVPFLNASEQSPPFDQMSTYFTSKGMVVIVPRYKIEILFKISRGLLRSVNIVVLCFILALLAGIIIWFIVSCYQ